MEALINWLHMTYDWSMKSIALKDAFLYSHRRACSRWILDFLQRHPEGMERTFIRKAVEYSLNEQNVDQILTRSQYQFYGWPFDIFSLVHDTENGAIDGLIRIEDEGENK